MAMPKSLLLKIGTSRGMGVYAGDDEHDFAARNHADADAQRADRVEIHEQRGEEAANDFADDGHEGEDNADFQHFRILQDTDVHQHAHDDEEYGHEEVIERIEG